MYIPCWSSQKLHQEHKSFFKKKRDTPYNPKQVDVSLLDEEVEVDAKLV